MIKDHLDYETNKHNMQNRIISWTCNLRAKRHASSSADAMPMMSRNLSELPELSLPKDVDIVRVQTQQRQATAKLGVGSSPIPFKKLTVRNLQQAIEIGVHDFRIR